MVWDNTDGDRMNIRYTWTKTWSAIKTLSNFVICTPAIDNYNAGTTFKSNDRCDIINGIEFQRWVLVSVVANSRTLDVYIDGKLARSCVYKSGFAIGAKGGNATAYFGLNNGGNLKGYFANGNFFKYALTPDAVWKIYQDGPAGPYSTWNWLMSLFSVNVTLNQSALSDLNPCTACQATG